MFLIQASLILIELFLTKQAVQYNKRYPLHIPQSRELSEPTVIKHDTSYNCFIVLSHVAMHRGNLSVTWITYNS